MKETMDFPGKHSDTSNESFVHSRSETVQNSFHKLRAVHLQISKILLGSECNQYSSKSKAAFLISPENTGIKLQILHVTACQIIPFQLHLCGNTSTPSTVNQPVKIKYVG